MFDWVRHISPRTKILFVAILLILIPSAILSYLGLLSIDQKAENLRTNYRTSIGLVRDKIEREIGLLEENIHNNIINYPPQSADAEELASWLHRLELDNPAVKHPFLTDKQGGIISTLLSLGWKNRLQSGSVRIVKETSFQKAEEAEYRRKDYQEAVNFYRHALAVARTPSDKALALSRIGRCCYGLAQYQEGIRAYEAILSFETQKLWIGPLPASTVSPSQIADGYEALGNQQKRLETLAALYRQLVHRPWPLDGGSYLYYLTSVGAALDTARTTAAPQIRQFKEQGQRITDQAKVLFLLQQEVVPSMESELKRTFPVESRPKHISVNNGGKVRRFGYLKLPPTFGQAQLAVLGYELQEDFLLKILFPTVLRSLDLGSYGIVGIVNESDSVLFIQTKVPAQKYLAAEGFTEAFIGWKVAFFDREGKSLQERVTNERQLYIVLLIGTICMIGVGIVVTARAANHEMDIARMKSDFVANVSHELKTPLALIRMFGETLEAGIVSDEKRRKEFYSIIRRESERLTHLINNVLDFSKMDAGNKVYNFEEADLVEVVRSTLEAYKFHIRDLGFEIESRLPSEPIISQVDKDAISQALLNLLSNATNYSANRKFLGVEVVQDSQSAAISVADQGVGIPKKELDKIFEKFYRASTTKTRETQGAGLGLTLVKHIVEAHKGSIEVESEEGKGSTFTLCIPITEPSEGSGGIQRDLRKV